MSDQQLALHSAGAAERIYERLVLGSPALVLGLTLLITLFFAWHSPSFQLDASADSLILENDQSLQYYRSVRSRYGSDDSLYVTYSPEGDLFDEAVLADLKTLRDKLAALENIKAVTSMLDVPLIESPPTTLTEISEQTNTIENGRGDIELARKEFTTSTLYRNLIMSPDARTTAMQVDFVDDDRYYELLDERDRLRTLEYEGTLDGAGKAALEAAEIAFYDYSKAVLDRQSEDIVAVRAILDEHRDNATIYLGGVPMIAADSIDFIRYDLVNFGTGVLAFLVVLLAVAFRRLRWVMLPMLTCSVSVVIMTGLLGLLNWPVTVVSSNFISLMLIITLSLTIHLIVRYREVRSADPEMAQYDLVKETLRSKFSSCFYTALTTIVAFGSLLFSGIRPVIDFGWMMAIGISIAFVLAFTLFPAVLVMLRPGEESEDNDFTTGITGMFASIIERFGKPTMAMFAVVLLLSFVGITRLSVENSFIDYFKEDTEIYQGMHLIDNTMGGTTPLEIIIDAPKEEEFEDDFEDEDDSFLADLFDDIKDDIGITTTSYWFNEVNLEEAEAIHDYLDGLSQTGKVISIVTAVRMLETLNEGETVDDFFLSIIHKRLPEDIKTTLFDPYMSADGNQLRFSIRVFESDPNLRRDELITGIREHLTTEMGLAEEQVAISGMVVLYNNMLQSLFQSQIMTLGVVFFCIMIMFMISFRSIKLALIAIIPNIFASAQVLGIMGWLNIPLDIMTITIAAIVIGIAVDNTIHFVHRFSEEIAVDGDYWATVERCHGSIGMAMYYTAITVTLGFMILVMSNFVPTIYFGLLTGFSMLIALVADMMLLPLLLVLFKPYDRRIVSEGNIIDA